MNLLCVDTSTPNGGLAVVRDDRVVASLQVTSRKTHAKRLMGAMDTVLGLAEMRVEDCDGFVVTVGPGSFTGLRIGISAVKGLAFATGRPVAGVSTLDVLAHQFPWFPHRICPMLDARKEQVFCALYRWDRADWERITPEQAVYPAPWLDTVEGPCLFVGDGAVLYRALVEEKLGPQALFAPPYMNQPRAAVVAHLGLDRFRQGLAVDGARLSPNYLRKSEAEMKRPEARAFRREPQQGAHSPL